MRYVFLREQVVANPALGVTKGTIVYVARLRKDLALASALLGDALLDRNIRVTDPRIEWAKTAGKCNNLCSSWHPDSWVSGQPCNCEAMTRARLMLREIDRKVTA